MMLLKVALRCDASASYLGNSVVPFLRVLGSDSLCTGTCRWLGWNNAWSSRYCKVLVGHRTDTGRCRSSSGQQVFVLFSPFPLVLAHYAWLPASSLGRLC